MADARTDDVFPSDGANGDGTKPQGDLIRAPRDVGLSLAVFVAVLVGAALYLAAVRREALFVDLAGLSGLLFCF